MTRLLVLALVACGGAKSSTTVEPPKPVEAALDPACPTTKTFTLADGKLRCRELPLTIDFPAGSAMERQDSDNLTFIRATLDRGVLAVFVEPRFDAVDDDAAGLRQRLEAVVKGIAEDSTIANATAPVQAGATVSTGISFTTPDGGAGLLYGYLAHGWFVAVIAGGRLAETPARPDKPMGKTFLASLKLRPTSTKWEPRDVFDGVKLELPVAAWELEVETSSIEKATKLYSAVGERVWIGARDLQQSPKCELFDGVTDADVPSIVKKMFGKDDLQVTGKLVKVGTQAMYAELATPGGTMVLYLVCVDPRVMLITVTGKRPPAELKTTIDRVTSSIKR